MTIPPFSFQLMPPPSLPLPPMRVLQPNSESYPLDVELEASIRSMAHRAFDSLLTEYWTAIKVSEGNIEAPQEKINEIYKRLVALATRHPELKEQLPAKIVST